MTVKERLDDQLTQLMSGVPSGTARTLTLSIPGGEFHCRLDEVTDLACVFQRITVAADSLKDAPLSRLEAIAESICRRVVYLLEAIHPVEIDHDRCVVQLRSKPPSRDEQATQYYELVVGSGQLTLERYEKQPGQPRRVIPATVTREVFLRLADDMLAALQS